jgi:putative DNA primase/helicase
MMNDYIEQFKNAMRDHGIEPPDNIIPDGVLHRFNAHKKGAGWYVLHSEDFWAGSFGDWSLDIKAKWHQDSITRTVISAKQRAEWDKSRKQREKAKQDQYEWSAKRSRTIYKCAHEKLYHDYSDAKGVNLYGTNAKVSDGVLLIPIFNSDMEIVNLQSILADGSKKFMYGAEIKGCFGSVGRGMIDKFYIAEGWATACSVSDHFKAPCFVAFSAGNLKPVAINLRAIYPDANIIIAADNDLSGVGEKAAIEAARAVGGSYIIPEEPGTDFNDVL